MLPEHASRILLVEDEPLSVRGLMRLFRTCGFETTVATSLAEARRLLASWSENACGYAFVDNKLGDGFGIDLLPDLQRLDPAPAVAIISNWMTSDLAARAFREGAVPMAKPEDEQTVRDLIALLAARKDVAAAPERTTPVQGATGLPEPPVRFGPFVLGDRELSTPTGRVQLRRKERAILAFLAERGGHPASPLQIASAALMRSDDGAVRTVYSHVTNLRAALGPYAALVETVPGAGGYRLALEIFER